MWVVMMATRVMSEQQQQGQWWRHWLWWEKMRGGWQRGWGWHGNCNGGKDGRGATAMATNRAVTMATRVSSKDEGEGEGGKSDGDGNEEGNCIEAGDSEQQRQRDNGNRDNDNNHNPQQQGQLIQRQGQRCQWRWKHWQRWKYQQCGGSGWRWLVAVAEAVSWGEELNWVELKMRNGGRWCILWQQRREISGGPMKKYIQVRKSTCIGNTNYFLRQNNLTKTLVSFYTKNHYKAI